MQVFSLSKSWIYFILFFCGLVILGSAYLLFFIALPGIFQNSMGKDWFLVGIAIFLLVLMIYFINEAIKGKFVIEHDRVYLVSSTATKELYFSEIKGYRVDDKYIYIEPISADKKKIKITKSFKAAAKIIVWLNQNYKDLDLAEKEEKVQAILNDVEYGFTTEEREQRFKSARTISIVINVTGIILALCVIIGSAYEKYLVALTVAAPVIFILILRSYKGLIKIEQKKSSPYPTILWGILAVIFALFMCGVQGSDILSYSNAWKPSILIGLSLLALLTIGNIEFRRMNLPATLGKLAMAVVMFGYGLSTILAINRVYDNSQPGQYQAEVLNKHINRGKSTSYHFLLSAWGPQNTSDDITVSSALYDRVEVTQHVNVYLYKGKLQIPWFIVTDK